MRSKSFGVGLGKGEMQSVADQWKGKGLHMFWVIASNRICSSSPFCWASITQKRREAAGPQSVNEAGRPTASPINPGSLLLPAC